jgi:hypothetical protein
MTTLATAETKWSSLNGKSGRIAWRTLAVGACRRASSSMLGSASTAVTCAARAACKGGYGAGSCAYVKQSGARIDLGGVEQEPAGMRAQSGQAVLVCRRSVRPLRPLVIVEGCSH